jgi:hypothetical protein
MEYNKDKVDGMVLALLYLTMFDEKPGFRAWQGHDWDALDPPPRERLHLRSEQQGEVGGDEPRRCTVRASAVRKTFCPSARKCAAMK